MSDTTIFSYIRQNVDIIDVVQNYVALKKAGSYFKGFSPFRSEKTPSFTVSPEKKIFYCFSTNIGGDVIDFISRIERCSQIEAAYFLKERYNLVLPADISRQHGKQQDNDTSSREMYYKVCSFFNKWLIEELKTYLPAQEYLARRAFSKMAINHFQLGYCPTGEQVVSRCIEEAKKNVNCSKSKSFLEKGIDFIENNVFSIDDMRKLCYKVIKTLGFKWYNLGNSKEEEDSERVPSSSAFTSQIKSSRNSSPTNPSKSEVCEVKRASSSSSMKFNKL